MQMMIPKNKLSKKARRKIDRQRRVVWDMNPTTRVKPSGKGYRREKNRAIMKLLAE